MGLPRHGLSHLPEYHNWKQMRQRCNNPNDPKYPRYGGRGIGISPEWDLFEEFYAYMGPRPSPTHSIDRYPNNNGNYEPGNCRWATAKQQARNQERTKFLTAFGETRPFTEWLEIYRLNHSFLRMRLSLGWPTERALTEPPHPRTPPPIKTDRIRPLVPLIRQMREAGRRIKDIAVEFGVSPALIGQLLRESPGPEGAKSTERKVA